MRVIIVAALLLFATNAHTQDSIQELMAEARQTNNNSLAIKAVLRCIAVTTIGAEQFRKAGAEQFKKGTIVGQLEGASLRFLNMSGRMYMGEYGYTEQEAKEAIDTNVKLEIDYYVAMLMNHKSEEGLRQAAQFGKDTDYCLGLDKVAREKEAKSKESSTD